MIYTDNTREGLTFVDLNRGTWLSPTWCDTSTGEFRGWIWLVDTSTGEANWKQTSGVFPFNVIRKGIVIDKGRP